MTSLDVIKLYENVADLSTQMLDAARDRDWNRLAELESRCTSQVDILRQQQTLPPARPAGTTDTDMPEALRTRKIVLIHKILANDREIRTITEPWMEELTSLMQRAGTERKLSRAYGIDLPE